VRGDLVRVGAAVGGGHAADALDAHALDVQRGHRRLRCGGPAGLRRGACRLGRRGAAGLCRRGAAGRLRAAGAGGAGRRRTGARCEYQQRHRYGGDEPRSLVRACARQDLVTPSRRAIPAGGRDTVPDRRPPTLSAMDRQTEWWHGSCAAAAAHGAPAARQPQRKPLALGAGSSGLDGRLAGGSGRLKPVGATSLGASG